MRSIYKHTISDAHKFLTKALCWALHFEDVCFLNSNDFEAGHFVKGSYSALLAVGSISRIIPYKGHFESLSIYSKETQDWLFGHLGYDLKNEIEGLKSENIENIGFPDMHFFQPQYVFEISNNEVLIHYMEEYDKQETIKDILADIEGVRSIQAEVPEVSFKSRVSELDYIDNVKLVQQHIVKGDVYEMCYCIEFYAKGAEVSPSDLYWKLNEMSPTPFSCFYKLGNKYLMSASPERFLKKENRHLISQPIKGTVKRGTTIQEDLKLKETMLNSAKERSENVMIVDLVRNDLSPFAVPGSVKVDELFGIYTFEQVHQMISTVSCDLRDDVSFVEPMKAAFPMGSMTGAPKISAMKLSEQYENTKRGLYSGAVGYIKPNMDFDFNVVIRSLQYNAENKYLSFMVGSAITALSVPEQEYNECLLKAQAMLKAVQA